MSKVLQLRGGTSVEHNNFIGANREVTVDTTKRALVVHDGVTAGGYPVAKSSDLGNKVDKVTGKQLSTEDYTSTEKTKLNGIAAGAQVNVATDLSLGTLTATTISLNSSTGNDVNLPSATTTTAGLLSAADKIKLNDIGTVAEFEASLL